MVAGAAAGVAAAATWLGKRRPLRAVPSPSSRLPSHDEIVDAPDSRHTDIRELSAQSPRLRERWDFAEGRDFDTLIERDSAELPIGRSADPDIDMSLSHDARQDETSGASLLTEPTSDEPAPRSADIDLALDDVWSSTPGIAEPEQSEGYDAVLPEDLGTVWIQRATQTTHEERPHASDATETPRLEDLISQASLESSRALDDDDDDEIADDDLDEGPLSPR
jgi:hypothetical protein